MQIAEVMTPGPDYVRARHDGGGSGPPHVGRRLRRAAGRARSALIGVVTDRDLFIALATRDAKPSELTVGTVCAPRRHVHAARRRASGDGQDEVGARAAAAGGGEGRHAGGIVSMNDLLLAIAPETALGGKVVDTLQTISEHQLPVPVAKTATA
jgi:hypothetical protein